MTGYVLSKSPAFSLYSVYVQLPQIQNANSH